MKNGFRLFMKGVLVNVCDVVKTKRIEDGWQINYISERKEYYRCGLTKHEDPEFFTFTYGDYPCKIPRIYNLRYIKPGEDYIFFQETFEVDGKRGRYIIGDFKISIKLFC